MIEAQLLGVYPKGIQVTAGLTKSEANGVVTLGLDLTDTELSAQLDQAVSTATEQAAIAVAAAEEAASSADLEITQDGDDAVPAPLILKAKQDTFHVADFASRNNYATIWNGTTMNTTAVAAALSAAKTLGRRRIHFPDVMRLPPQNVGGPDYRDVYGVLVSDCDGMELVGHGCEILMYERDTTLHSGIFQFLRCKNIAIEGFRTIAQSGAEWTGVTEVGAAPFIAAFHAGSGLSLEGCSAEGGLGLCDIQAEDVRNGFDADLSSQATQCVVSGRVENTTYGMSMMGVRGINVDVRSKGPILRGLWIGGYAESIRAALTMEGGDDATDSGGIHISPNFQSNVRVRDVKVNILARNLNTGRAVDISLAGVINPAAHEGYYEDAVSEPLVEGLTVSGQVDGGQDGVHVGGTTAIEEGGTPPVIRGLRLHNLSVNSDLADKECHAVNIAMQDLPSGSVVQDLRITDSHLKAGGDTTGSAVFISGDVTFTMANTKLEMTNARPCLYLSGFTGRGLMTGCETVSTSDSDHGIVRTSSSGDLVVRDHICSTGLSGIFAPANWTSDTGSTRFEGSFTDSSGVYSDGPLFLGTISSNLLDITRGLKWRLAPGSATDLKGFTGATLLQGSVVVLVFEDGNTTLKHDATTSGQKFALKGATDYNPSAGAIVKFRWSGSGAWVEESRNA